MRARRNNRGCACKAMGVGCVSVCGCRVGVCRNRDVCFHPCHRLSVVLKVVV